MRWRRHGINSEGLVWSSPELLFDVEEDLAAVGFGADGKVEPEGGGALLDDKFVKVFTCAVGDVEEDGSVAQGLFLAETSDVGCTPHEVIGGR